MTHDELGAALDAATAARADDDVERLLTYARHETPTGDAGGFTGAGEFAGASPRRPVTRGPSTPGSPPKSVGVGTA